MRHQKGTFKRWFWLGGFLSILIAVLTACGSATTSSTPAGSVNVQITLSDYKIVSSLTQFSKGVPYHFVLTNKGAVEHEFLTAPPMTKGMTMDDVDRQRLFEVESIAPGETKSFDFTFKESAPSGKLEFSCHEPGHYEAGMLLGFVVG